MKNVRNTLAKMMPVMSVVMGANFVMPQMASAQLEEVVVTAQRREQSAQDIGIAINAFSGQELRDLGVEKSIDIARFSPGVYISSTGGGQNNQFTIRGVTQNDFNDSVEAPIAVYVDEGYIPTQQGQTQATFDLNRAEILKGPQGTLFGRNATGGLVHFIPNKPTRETEGYVDFTIGDYDNIEVEAAIGGPLSETVAGRISILSAERDGFLENLFPAGAATVGATPAGGGQDSGGKKTTAVRGQLLFEPNENLDIRLVASYAEEESGVSPYNVRATEADFNADGAQINTRLLPEGTPILGFLGFLFPEVLPGFTGYTPPASDALQNSADWSPDQLFNTESTAAAMHINYETDNYTITSITDYKDFEKFNGTDVEASPINFVNFASEPETSAFSQELRIAGSTDRLEWTAGLYYLDIDTKVSSGFLAPANSLFTLLIGLDPFFDQGLDLINQFRLETQSSSIFGHVEYKLNDAWSVTAGARFINEDQDYSNVAGFYLNSDDFGIETDTLLFNTPTSVEDIVSGTPTTFTDSRSTSLFAAKLQLDYRPNDATLVYFGLNRGVKGGAYNAPLPDGATFLTQDQLSYDDETLMAYEAGVKTSWAEDKYRLNASVYYYDYEDYQAFTFANVSGVVFNNDANTTGFELELIARPTDRLSFGVGFSKVDAEIEQLPIAPGVLRDVEPTFTPDTQLNGMISYDIPDVLNGSVRLGANISWSEDYWDNIRNFDAARRDGYTLTDVRATWQSTDEHWSVTAFLNNAFDERYALVGFDLVGLCGCNEESYGAPRQWGLKVGYRF